MKKILAIMLTVALLLSVMSFGASAYTINKDDAEVDADLIFGSTAVYFEDATVEAGNTVTVDLMLESNPGITYLNVSFELPEGISVTEIAAGDIGANTSDSDNSVVIESEDAIAADGCIAKVTFTATAAGTYDIILTATAKNGDDAVNVNGSTCHVTATEAAVEAVEGDVNGDGAMNTTDLAVLKIFLASDERTEDVVNPDVDGDGLENTSDLAALKLMLAGN